MDKAESAAAHVFVATVNAATAALKEDSVNRQVHEKRRCYAPLALSPISDTRSGFSLCMISLVHAFVVVLAKVYLVGSRGSPLAPSKSRRPSLIAKLL